MLNLQPLSLDNCQTVRKWRNQELNFLRTPYGLTEEMQAKFYADAICDRRSPHRYYAVCDNDEFIGMGGICNIEWENSLGEISLIIDPKKRGNDYGAKSVALLLDNGWRQLNLKTIFGECYLCNKYVDFWRKICAKYDAPIVTLKNRKFWQGQYWDSIYFSFVRP